MSFKPKFYILTGDPGVGKTTIIKNIVSTLSEEGVKITGFYTEETRKNGTREGFDIVTVDGERGRLARDQNILTGPIKCKIGKYGVLVEEFEKIALPCINKPTNIETHSHVYVIDEIGKMEFFSQPFKSRVKDIFSDTSNNIVLATIPVRKSDSLIENIRNHSKAKVWTITRENRNSIKDEILREMDQTLKLKLYQ